MSISLRMFIHFYGAIVTNSFGFRICKDIRIDFLVIKELKEYMLLSIEIHLFSEAPPSWQVSEWYHEYFEKQAVSQAADHKIKDLTHLRVSYKGIQK